ncbi:hypothetical protein SAMN05192558_12810 [Actinokineospora alba]|uniref:DUF3558 domain-containing protein n=1 Tax=Actinokineospora alba TaxID=504798 RepID=A0A1H0WP63_9PSEU|nr:hypothetical protein [Actinokineospora alba]TDP65670.1 hypothetical protein C8E96_1157 [Actinokineospora alba]SDJ54962.1 hypothetical protein SAMN05421871_1225 [Actinokineospora alba]SDP92500.1 hypothetical protein SAMN05192558_12810 [Actinokineospora alba]
MVTKAWVWTALLAASTAVAGCGEPEVPGGSSPRVSDGARQFVERACQSTPEAVSKRIPGAVATYRADAPGGLNCSWSAAAGNPLDRVLLAALQQGDLAAWRKLNAGTSEDLVIRDRPAVLARNDKGCSVLLEIESTVVSADFGGGDDSDCGHAKALIEELTTP